MVLFWKYNAKRATRELTDSRKQRRQRAAAFLVDSGDPDGHQLLAETAVRHEEADVRLSSAQAIVDAADERAWLAVVKGLGAPREEHQYVNYRNSPAIEIIRRLGSKALVVVLDALQAPDLDHRRAATWALGAVCEDEATEKLFQLLDDEELNHAALCGIRLLPAPPLDKLIAMYDSSNVTQRLQAIHCLPSPTDDALFEHLWRALEDEDQEVRIIARGSLRGSKSPEISDKLLDRLPTASEMQTKGIVRYFVLGDDPENDKYLDRTPLTPKLVQAAIEHEDETTHETCREIVKHYSSSEAWAAFDAVDDPELLDKLVETGAFPPFYDGEIASRVESEDILVELACGDGWWEAVEKINDSLALVEVIRCETAETAARCKAANRLLDQEQLLNVARDPKLPAQVRTAATESIDDQQQLEELARSTDDQSLQRSALAKLKDESIVSEIAQSKGDAGTLV